MTIPGEVQNFHGTNGESQTQGILSRRFWFLRRPVDIEGADFLVQLRVDSIDKIQSRNPEMFVLGIVQSKFFTAGTTLNIKKDYVLNKRGEPIKQFFLMCHTMDEQENVSNYFFTANEIKEIFTLDEEKDVFKLFIGKGKKYGKYKDRPAKDVLDEIESGIKAAEEQKNTEYVSRLFFYYFEAGRNYGGRHFYLLRHVEGLAVVLTENSENGSTELLEPRRDLFENFGGFTWGYEGTGPHFLAYSLLAHMKDGQAPTWGEVNTIVDWILSALVSEQNWDISPEIIQTHLKGKMLTQGHLRSICKASETESTRLH